MVCSWHKAAAQCGAPLRPLLEGNRTQPERSVLGCFEPERTFAIVAVGTRVSSRPPAQNRTCGFPAYGSHLGSKRQAVAACVPAPVTREPGAESSACFAGPHSPWSAPFAPPTPLRLTPPRTAPQRAPLCSPASSLLWRGP